MRPEDQVCSAQPRSRGVDLTGARASGRCRRAGAGKSLGPPLPALRAEATCTGVQSVGGTAGQQQANGLGGPVDEVLPCCVGTPSAFGATESPWWPKVSCCLWPGASKVGTTERPAASACSAHPDIWPLPWLEPGGCRLGDVDLLAIRDVALHVHARTAQGWHPARRQVRGGVRVAGVGVDPGGAEKQSWFRPWRACRPPSSPGRRRRRGTTGCRWPRPDAGSQPLKSCPRGGSRPTDSCPERSESCPYGRGSCAILLMVGGAPAAALRAGTPAGLAI